MTRALTLVETVAATALLALVVAACVPLLVSARRDLDAAHVSTDREHHREMSNAVDELLTQRPRLVRQLLDQPTGLPVQWELGDRTYAAHATVRAQSTADGKSLRSSHAWIVFETDGVEIARWARLPNPPTTPTPRTTPTPLTPLQPENSP
ncbi:MAG: hypothetical protein Q9O74_00990 [Planctomycetota bacterium]|nr:hypothetical protein [Planctomycetota bacterium]